MATLGVIKLVVADISALGMIVIHAYSEWNKYLKQETPKTSTDIAVGNKKLRWVRVSVF